MNDGYSIEIKKQLNLQNPEKSQKNPSKKTLLPEKNDSVSTDSNSIESKDTAKTILKGLEIEITDETLEVVNDLIKKGVEPTKENIELILSIEDKGRGSNDVTRKEAVEILSLILDSKVASEVLQQTNELPAEHLIQEIKSAIHQLPVRAFVKEELLQKLDDSVAVEKKIETENPNETVPLSRLQNKTAVDDSKIKVTKIEYLNQISSLKTGVEAQIVDYIDKDVENKITDTLVSSLENTKGDVQQHFEATIASAEKIEHLLFSIGVSKESVENKPLSTIIKIAFDYFGIEKENISTSEYEFKGSNQITKDEKHPLEFPDKIVEALPSEKSTSLESIFENKIDGGLKKDIPIDDIIAETKTSSIEIDEVSEKVFQILSGKGIAPVQTFEDASRLISKLGKKVLDDSGVKHQNLVPSDSVGSVQNAVQPKGHQEDAFYFDVKKVVQKLLNDFISNTSDIVEAGYSEEVEISKLTQVEITKAKPLLAENIAFKDEAVPKQKDNASHGNSILSEEIKVQKLTEGVDQLELIKMIADKKNSPKVIEVPTAEKRENFLVSKIEHSFLSKAIENVSGVDDFFKSKIEVLAQETKQSLDLFFKLDGINVNETEVKDEKRNKEKPINLLRPLEGIVEKGEANVSSLDSLKKDLSLEKDSRDGLDIVKSKYQKPISFKDFPSIAETVLGSELNRTKEDSFEIKSSGVISKEQVARAKGTLAEVKSLETPLPVVESLSKSNIENAEGLGVDLNLRAELSQLFSREEIQGFDVLIKEVETFQNLLNGFNGKLKNQLSSEFLINELAQLVNEGVDLEEVLTNFLNHSEGESDESVEFKQLLKSLIPKKNHLLLNSQNPYSLNQTDEMVLPQKIEQLIAEIELFERKRFESDGSLQQLRRLHQLTRQLEQNLSIQNIAERVTTHRDQIQSLSFSLQADIEIKPPSVSVSQERFSKESNKTNSYSVNIEVELSSLGEVKGRLVTNETSKQIFLTFEDKGLKALADDHKEELNLKLKEIPFLSQLIFLERTPLEVSSLGGISNTDESSDGHLNSLA